MKAKVLIGITMSLFVSSLAFAGVAGTFPVEIVINDDGSGLARGNIVTARTSDNEFELIGCGLKTFKSGGPPEYGFCQAADSEDNFVSCDTSDKSLLEAMKAIGDYSYIRFDFDKKGGCTRLDFSTQSFYLPANVEGN